jgi:glycosyltransferase involved in cell wall biosynthesis
LPAFKYRRVFEIARELKGFLRVDAGLTRGEVPDPERQLEAQTQELRQARSQLVSQAKRLNEQSERLKRLRERLSDSRKQVTGLRERLSDSRKQVTGLRERLSDSEQQVAGLRKQLSDSRKQITGLQEQLSNRGHRVTELRTKLEVVSAGALATARRTPSVTKQVRKLAILDNVFPHLLSAFRIAEYNAYLEKWEDASVFSTALGFPALHEMRGFQEVLDEYASRYPQFKGRVRGFDAKSDLEDRLVYTMFLTNADFFLDAIHAYNAPFVFTLYPGGRFQLNDEESDDKLRRVCSSPNLEKVITTQKATHEYLLGKQFCDPAKTEFVYGGVFPLDHLLGQSISKQRYEDKYTFDVCFVAHKYTERGTDKGYDVFIELAKLLSEAHKDVFFHVVGPFDETDVDVSGIEDRITFYGTRFTEFFPGFYSRMDAIVSPNVPFVLGPGTFDGFPTGACIEAGACGVAVFCTDPLNQNVAFEDGEEIVIVPRDAKAICATLERYHERPEDLCELSIKGQKAFLRVFDMEAQMGPRLRILSEPMRKEYIPPDKANSSNARDDGRRMDVHSH